ncbi:MAG: hypothetical protein OER74_20920, partial [Desulfobacteraceae bacterium]|nr:hypothetical protein [Desulfobacteraceae bacterium]
YQKTKYHPSTDILRETQVSQFYRYAKISQLLEAGQFCRYVGVITGFVTDFIVTISCIGR